MIKIFKPRTCLTGIFLLFALGVMAQDSANTVKPFTGSKGFRKFSIGLNAGFMGSAVATGGSNDFSNWKSGFGYGLNLKYQATHWLAFQANGYRGNLKGDQTNKLGNGQAPGRAVDEFKTQLNWGWDVSTIFSPANVNWLSRKVKIVPYIGAGAGLVNYKPQIRRLGTTTFFNYNGDKNITEYVIPVSAGLKFALSKAMNLDIGYRMFYLDGDNLDGFPYNAPTKDKYSYAFLGLDFALGNSSKPQLMFNNPAAAEDGDIRNQLTELRLMIDMADTDGDGVPDKFDKEPNTPINCPVDTKGISRDTDGDGIPDCRDKQLITPTECQPVDPDGVGKCPPPACCGERNNPVDNGGTSCTIGDLPSIAFKGTSAALSADAKAMLATVASKLRANAGCTINILGYAGTSKAAQKLCNARTEAIMMHLNSKEGITAERIMVRCQVGGGEVNTVDITSAAK